MQENKNDNDENITPKEKKPAPKSFLENVREINEREHQAELEAERKRTEAAAKKNAKERSSYQKKLEQERIELMKLKAGVISEEDIPKEEKVEKVYTTREKISNFFYHNKLYLIMGAFAATLVIWFTYDFVTRVDPDVNMLIISRDDNFSNLTDSVQNALAPYCEDFNGDGKVVLNVQYIPALVNDETDNVELYYAQADQTKLMGEFQTDTTIMIVTDKVTCEKLGIANDDILTNMTTVYPDDPNAAELGYSLNGTSFAKDIGYDGLRNDLFMSFREPWENSIGVNGKRFRSNYDNALKLWDNYIKGNVVNETQEAITE